MGKNILIGIVLLAFPMFCISQIELEGNFIQVKTSGGIPPYLHSLDSINYQSNDTFKCLVPATYILFSKDSVQTYTKKTIILYGALTITTTSTNNSITAIASGGKPPYKYSKNSTTIYQTSNVFTGLKRRTSYTIRVKDALGYIASIVSITL